MATLLLESRHTHTPKIGESSALQCTHTGTHTEAKLVVIITDHKHTLLLIKCKKKKKMKKIPRVCTCCLPPFFCDLYPLVTELQRGEEPGEKSLDPPPTSSFSSFSYLRNVGRGQEVSCNEEKAEKKKEERCISKVMFKKSIPVAAVAGKTLLGSYYYYYNHKKTCSKVKTG